MKPWAELTVFEKVVSVISWIATGIWAVCVYMLTSETGAVVEMLTYISLVVICTCQAILFWKVKRGISYLAIGGMVLMLAAVILLAL